MSMYKRVALPVGLVLAVLSTGCGVAHHQVVKAPTGVARDSAIHVADANVSSKEQNDKAAAVNEKAARFARTELVAALGSKGGYRVSEGADAPGGALVLETTIYIVYGNRALRYFVGFGAGKGSCQINFELKDASTGEVMYAVESKSDMSMGAYGGSMDRTVLATIEAAIKTFVAEL